MIELEKTIKDNKKIIIDDNYVYDGWFAFPHYLYKLVSDKKITKSEFTLIGLLLHFENRYTKHANQWFFVNDEKICITRLMAPKTLIKARHSLKEKGIIDFKRGYSHHSTDYRILLAGFYYSKESTLV